jgi:hypothetical protein
MTLGTRATEMLDYSLIFYSFQMLACIRGRQ